MVARVMSYLVNRVNRCPLEFYGKYFLHALRTAKELELMQLKQKNMAVADYTREFDNLCRLSRVFQGNPADYEEWKCAQYEKGFRRDIFLCVSVKVNKFH